MADPRHSTPAKQKEASQRRARGATLDEVARSYNVGISTIRRVTRAAEFRAGNKPNTDLKPTSQLDKFFPDSQEHETFRQNVLE